MRTSLKIVVLLNLIVVGHTFAQNLEEKLLRLIDQNNLEQIYNNLALIKQKFPEQPIPYYVEAFIERDADYASQLYRDFIERFPQSNYTASARYKIAQYYVARNEYQQAIDVLDKLLTLHPKSPLTDDAAYLKIISLLALDRITEAKMEYQKFIRIHSDSFFKNILMHDFAVIDSGAETAGLTRTISKKNVFTIQVGAFGNEENARLLKDKISNRGYPAFMSTKFVEQKLFHVVWVGSFESHEQAEAFGELFKREFEIPIRIVQK